MLGQSPADRARAEGMDPVHVPARARRTDGVGQTPVPFAEQAVGTVGQRPLVMAFRVGIHRQGNPLIKPIGGRLVRAHHVERREDQISFGPENAVGIIIKPKPAVLRVLLAVAEEMPVSQVPLGRQPFRGHPHPHGRLEPRRRRGVGRQVGAARRGDRALPGLLVMRAGLLADGAQFPGLKLRSELTRVGGRRGQHQRRVGRDHRGMSGALLRIKMPDAGLTLGIRMRIPGLQGADHLLRQVPRPLASAHLGQHQLDDGGVTIVCAFRADHQRNRITRFDGDLA